MPLRTTSFKILAKEKNSNKEFKSVFVNLLDDNLQPLEIKLSDHMHGTELLDEVCRLLGGILERDYFGLRYIYKDKIKRWLDGSQSVYHQIKKANTITLSFRVMHYPSNPVDNILQDISQYFIYLQLRRDLYSGYILVKGDILTKLISLAILAEEGDITNPTPNDILKLVTKLNIIENLNSKTLDEVSQSMITLSGLTAKEAEKQFMTIISHLESYGVEPYFVTDQSGEKLYIAINHHGICTFIGDKRKNIYYWENITRLMVDKKWFTVAINIDNKKKRFQFKFASGALAREFWKWSTDRQYFMTLNSAGEAKTTQSNNRIFCRKISHKFSGRSLKELTASCRSLNDLPQLPRIRSNSSKEISRHSVVIDEMTHNMYATMPRPSRQKSILSENNSECTVEQVTSATSEESILITSQQKDAVIIEPYFGEEKIVEEIVASCESDIRVSSFSQFEEIYDDSDVENEVRERRIDLDQGVGRSRVANGPMMELDVQFDDNNIDDNYRIQNIDGVFFVKFVVLTTLILLVVMITSLVAYYYYRSSTIADLNKQKYSTEWNKNIDLESIKRFVLRNDAP